MKLPSIARLLGHGLWVGAVLLLAILAGVAIGETPISVSIIAQVLANKLWGAGFAVDPIDEGIVWNYRLTRAIVAAACGAGLAVSGVVLQSLLRNALADPYLLGISAGASTGAVLVAVIGVGGGAVSLSMGAFAGAAAAFAMVALLARVSRGQPATGQIILAGIAGSQLFNALTSLLITKSANAEQARGILFWLLGNLSGVRWSAVALSVPVVLLGLGVCLWHRRSLDAFTFGTDAAASLGIPVRQVQILLIASTALITAVMVSLVGSIGFVGLVIPHAVRMATGVRHARLLPLSALSGALFLVAADVVSRTLIKGQVLPIGVITALVGAPVFALILIRGNRSR
ncbi:iron ABC transporter permease [Pseudomonas sp. GD03842]|uniref:FecCD family ABC transporter permease n=1 Tax=unclassified Pseudomonas TaxID=196821 RepID=UPI000D39D230|nr:MULTISPECIES: iron chelate uptake ABC transporter family permease subunit [unclassified Pseudomonas]MDH0744968.1 iron ABC transporter permease [Pseudomonas sp. GD03842]RAU41483.1 iron ABC transporter permease [Pseudomonas sp. RIT 409]RAU53306.1 iron ABC transporter permease [Pseudomonas sp. RIT 412]